MGARWNLTDIEHLYFQIMSFIVKFLSFRRIGGIVCVTQHPYKTFEELKNIGISFYFLIQTRLLVTHGVQWLPKVDRIAVISDGEISEIGSYDELLTRNGAFAQFLKTFLLKEDSDDSESDDPESKLNRLLVSVVTEGVVHTVCRQ